MKHQIKISKTEVYLKILVAVGSMHYLAFLGFMMLFFAYLLLKGWMFITISLLIVFWILYRVWRFDKLFKELP